MIDQPQSEFKVVGIGLMESSRQRLTSVFPDCLLYSSDPASKQKALSVCQQAGKVTLFVDVEPNAPGIHARASLEFDQANVKVLGLCKKGCAGIELYDTIFQFEFAGALELDADDETFRRAAAAVQRGEIWVPREYLSAIASEYLKNEARLNLTEREIAILKLLVPGKSNQEIADDLFLSRETIRWHLKSLYAKLGVSDREAARRFASNYFNPQVTSIRTGLEGGVGIFPPVQ